MSRLQELKELRETYRDSKYGYTPSSGTNQEIANTYAIDNFEWVLDDAINLAKDAEGDER